ncbi:MAG: hypothetical protein H7338_08610 [Candidatus Sericytochromatia bacterium]|nr:hypothetical protein [Candidatus Sericytochromatia bacterium]
MMSKDGKIESKPVMMAGEKFVWKADKPGKIPYTCSIHPGMDGSITVK